MNYWELVMYIKRAVNHLKLEKFSILGHSMGGGTGILVASLYPDLVDRVLTLDIIKPITVPLAWHTQSITEAIDLHLDLERKSGNPKYQKSYTLEELVDRYVQAMGGAINPDAVRILLKRGSKGVGNGYAYSHDPRMVIICCSFFRSSKWSRNNSINQNLPTYRAPDVAVHHAIRAGRATPSRQRSAMPFENRQGQTRTAVRSGRFAGRVQSHLPATMRLVRI